jgi:hypothetical protein
VLLPAPFGPSKPTISPRATENEMSSTAVRPAYRFVKLETSIMALHQKTLRSLAEKSSSGQPLISFNRQNFRSLRSKIISDRLTLTDNGAKNSENVFDR